MTQKDNKRYRHVLKWNADGIQFNGLISPPTKAYLLSDRARKLLMVEQDKNTGMTMVKIPPEAPGPNVCVIGLDFDGPIKTDPNAEGKYCWTKGTDIKLLKKQ